MKCQSCKREVTDTEVSDAGGVLLHIVFSRKFNVPQTCGIVDPPPA